MVLSNLALVTFKSLIFIVSTASSAKSPTTIVASTIIELTTLSAPIVVALPVLLISPVKLALVTTVVTLPTEVTIPVKLALVLLAVSTYAVVAIKVELFAGACVSPVVKVLIVPLRSPLNVVAVTVPELEILLAPISIFPVIVPPASASLFEISVALFVILFVLLLISRLLVSTKSFKITP